MGALRRAGVWLGLVEEDPEYGRADRASHGRERGYDGRADFDGSRSAYPDDEYDDRGYAEEYADDVDSDYEAEPARAHREESVRAARTASVSPIDSAASARRERATAGAPGFATSDNLALAPQQRERAAMSEMPEPYRITTLHPKTYNEARTIGEQFRNNIPVIMNLTEMEESDAKRLVDFAAGLAFGLRGSIDRVTNRVFLLSPANVTVTAEERAKIAEGGFFNQS